MAKVLIAGFGDVGRRLARLLTQSGHEVLAGCRSEPEAEFRDLWVSLDLLQAETFDQKLSEVDFVVYLPTPGARSEEAYRHIFCDGLHNLFEFVGADQAQWIFVSSTGVYGQCEGEFVDEKSVTNPKRYSGQILLEAEQWLLDQHQGDEAQACVVRLAGIYGPGRNRLLRLVAEGKPVCEQPPYYTNRIHSEDAARLLQFLIEKKLLGENWRPHYLGVDDAPVTEYEVQQWIAKAMGVSTLPVENDGSKGQNKRCQNQLIRGMGFDFLYPTYKEGYQLMVDEYLLGEDGR